MTVPAIAALGIPAERIFGAKGALALYLVPAAIGEGLGYVWQPHGLKRSIAVLGLVSGLVSWLFLEAQEKGWPKPCSTGCASGAPRCWPERSRTTPSATSTACPPSRARSSGRGFCCGAAEDAKRLSAAHPTPSYATTTSGLKKHDLRTQET